MKEIILSSGIGFGIGAFFTLCRIPMECDSDGTSPSY